MKTLSLFGLALALVAGLLAPTVAASETTLDGSIMCAKCKLKKADAKECQDVLVVKGDAGATSEYYIAKNAVSEKFGHVCSGETAAAVTGEVAQKDGKQWITPSKMEKKG
jgi:aspartate 1-decarboxylase